MENIWLHISRKITGEASDDDDEIVEMWLNKEKKNKFIYSQLIEIWNYKATKETKLPYLYWKVKNRIQNFERGARIRNLYIQISKIAAVVVLFVSLFFFAYHYFTDRYSGNNRMISYNTIVVPKGNRSQIVLPDSTKVWLNNDTKLKFPDKFQDGSREVELVGEAYFEVKHDENRPFLVKVGNNSVKVLGTTFSISAYPDDPFIETSLITGRVIFQMNNISGENSTYELSPGFSLIYNKDKNLLSKRVIDESFYDYWKKGVYTFKNESLESLAIKIYRIYNIQILIDSEYLRHKTYTGTLSMDDNIFTFVEAIKRTTGEPIEYNFDKNKIYLKMKRL